MRNIPLSQTAFLKLCSSFDVFCKAVLPTRIRFYKSYHLWKQKTGNMMTYRSVNTAFRNTLDGNHFYVVIEELGQTRNYGTISKFNV